MIEQTYLELMHKAIDGEITEEERKRLEAYLRTHPQAEHYFRQLQQTNELLQNVPSVEPPADLKASILNSLDPTRYSRTPKSSFLFSLQEWFRRPAPRLAYAFAMGILVGILSYVLILSGLFHKTPLDQRQLYGTMGLESSRILLLEELPVQVADLQGKIILKKTDQRFLLEANLQSFSGNEIRFNFNPLNIRIEAFLPSEQTPIQFRTGEGRAEITWRGNTHFTLEFHSPENISGEIIQFFLLQKGKIIFQHQFQLTDS